MTQQIVCMTSIFRRTISTNSCTSPMPSVLIFPISRDTSAPSASRYKSPNGEQWDVHQPTRLTLAASASRSCLSTSPRCGAGNFLRNKCASLDLSKASRSSRGDACSGISPTAVIVEWRGRTDWTRAKTSPVVGQTLSRMSPVPPHVPSYTPGTSVVKGMSKALRRVEALVDKFRTLDLLVLRA